MCWPLLNTDWSPLLPHALSVLLHLLFSVDPIHWQGCEFPSPLPSLWVVTAEKAADYSQGSFASLLQNTEGDELLLTRHVFSISPASFFFSFIFISWRLITLQYCSGFCHTLTWISHGVTCIPHPDPPSHLPFHRIPLGLPSAPSPSTCLMHPTWAGDLFHYR